MKSVPGSRLLIAALTMGLVTGLLPAAAHAATGRAATGRAHATGARPRGRAWPSFAYDAALDETVMFGGDDGSKVLGGTWTYSGGTWTREAPASTPAPRTGAALVYDAATSQLLLFGGSSKIGTAGGYFGDTWVWTGTTWTELHPATSPPARHNADMIYDAADHDVVLFGGYDGQYLGDTWTWNGSTWTHRDTATAPAPRDTGSFGYDAATGTGLLYGGYNGVTAFTDTWTWNGSAWARLSPSARPGPVTAGWQMAGDAATGQVLMFGGNRSGPTDSSMTWAWNGTTWTRLRPAASPYGRDHGSMTYDSATQQIILFGGQGDQQDNYPSGVWVWTGTTWQNVT